MRAPQYVAIRQEAQNTHEIDAQLQALGYAYQLQRKRWRVWRESRRLPTFSSDLVEAKRPAGEVSAPQTANRATICVPQPWATSSVLPEYLGQSPVRCV